ncbi:MAG TPA: hypothetical protein VFD36_14950, partial [Kofleriaceae bacterium]|nr:hypothetical protein [Kofleriaceae bacterium]
TIGTCALFTVFTGASGVTIIALGGVLMPAGASLIILHTLLHMVIDIDYLVRGKTPPERMRSGH